MIDLTDWISNRVIAGVSVIAVVPILFGFLVLVVLLPDLNRSNQAIVIATGTGAFGTLILALATFFNIVQSNQVLQIREKKRQKPLAIDEISNLIEPGIETVKANLEAPKNSHGNGCGFEWNYLDPEELSQRGRRPHAIFTSDSIALSRLSTSRPDLVEQITAHNGKIGDVAERTQRFQEQIHPKIREFLEESDRGQDIDSDLRVITSAILKEVDQFGESSDLYQFWEEYGDRLIQYSKDLPEAELEEIQKLEQEYLEVAKETFGMLEDRKLELKKEYGISEEEISFEKNILERT
ncbi:hypothetical protein [Natrinema sp. HArc-T2]|uniref:hypothetical protein n=1 Tax=Natrinema sp. HArc-T2 TaxID=3242701 RepID=UPI00359DAE06